MPKRPTTSCRRAGVQGAREIMPDYRRGTIVSCTAGDGACAVTLWYSNTYACGRHRCGSMAECLPCLPFRSIRHARMHARTPARMRTHIDAHGPAPRPMKRAMKRSPFRPHPADRPCPALQSARDTRPEPPATHVACVCPRPVQNKACGTMACEGPMLGYPTWPVTSCGRGA